MIKKITINIQNICIFKMSLSTGDILAIVFGSILGLVILGYLIYILLFRKKSGVSLMQVKEYLKNNPGDRNEIASYLNTTELSSTPKVDAAPATSVYNDRVLNEVDESEKRQPAMSSPIMLTPVR
jgi:flagellar basal body-associated protein FliL